MIHSLIDSVVNFVNHIGYFGIFIGMFVESTLIPIPSELIMIPAGLAASRGLMNVYILNFVGIAGNIAGAVFSYYLALKVGNPVLLKIGKYFFVKEETILKIEKYFNNHGPISVFIGRLLPGFRHFISLPAGLAKMDIKLFFIYTTLGSAIWTSILTFLGFTIGENQQLIEENLKELVIGVGIFCLVIVVIYIAVKKRKNPHS